METDVLAPSAEGTPSEIFAEVFSAIAMREIVPAKDWADATPKAPPEDILESYRRERPATDAALAAFVHRWFDVPGEIVATHGGETVSAYIDATWSALIRPPVAAASPSGSLLALPHPSMAPGGRFRECYYWDAYFTLLGLRDRPDLIRAAVDNFCWQIGAYGFVPTANRSYYLTRSHPPLLFKIVELLADVEGAQVIDPYLGALVAEYDFWMDGADRVAPGDACRRVVRLPDGSVLNRYWDDSVRPRDESYRVDVEAAVASSRAPPEVFRDIRAAAESGWDFSSRWLDRAGDFGSIATTSMAPVDLNSMLFGLERFIAEGFAALGQPGKARDYAARAAQRREAMCKYLWNADLGAFDDYNWRLGQVRGAFTAAALYPLFFKVASPAQADSTAKLVERDLLARGGLLTTLEHTGMQWDAPNGWAPLQWIGAQGLVAYDHTRLAGEIRTRWLRTVTSVFQETGALVEKYNVVTCTIGGGGEYPLQDGFGWTNGVTKAFSEALD